LVEDAMREHLPILVELLLVFGGALAFGWWQLRDVARAQQRTRAERDAAAQREAMAAREASTAPLPAAPSSSPPSSAPPTAVPTAAPAAATDAARH
jgi:cytoskeletal protein RodZ